MQARLPGLRFTAERLKESEQVGGFLRAQSQWLENSFAVRMQALFIQFRIVPDHIGQRRMAAGVHVGGGARDVAQTRHLEFAPMSVFEA